MSDPDKTTSYGPGAFREKSFYEYGSELDTGKEVLLVPMDSRCVAGPCGTEEYVFDRHRS